MGSIFLRGRAFGHTQQSARLLRELPLTVLGLFLLWPGDKALLGQNLGPLHKKQAVPAHWMSSQVLLWIPLVILHHKVIIPCFIILTFEPHIAVLRESYLAGLGNHLGYPGSILVRNMKGKHSTSCTITLAPTSCLKVINNFFVFVFFKASQELE